MSDIKSFIDVPAGRWRFFGTPHQQPVHSEQEVKSLIEHANYIRDCYISISSFSERDGIIHMIPFDFDSEDLDLAYLEARILYDYLSANNVLVALHFSGGGYHCIIKTLSDISANIKRFQNDLASAFKFKTIDKRIFGDTRRLIRIPGTWNIRRQKMCEVIRGEDIWKKAPSVRIGNLTGRAMQPLTASYTDVLIHDYPCIWYYIQDSRPPHPVRFSYVVLRMHLGASSKQILKECEEFGWADFDKDKTAYYIEHIFSVGYHMPTCATISGWGLCLLHECEYYREKISNLKEVR